MHRDSFVFENSKLRFAFSNFNQIEIIFLNVVYILMEKRINPKQLHIKYDKYIILRLVNTQTMKIFNELGLVLCVFVFVF